MFSMVRSVFAYDNPELLPKEQTPIIDLAKTLSEKAKGSKFTAAQLRKSYNKGLAAYGSSGSRKGMTAHQWAMARVNMFLKMKRGGKVKDSYRAADGDI